LPCRSAAGSRSCQPQRRSAAQSAPATHASVGCSPIRSRPPAVRGRPVQTGPRCLSSSSQTRMLASRLDHSLAPIHSHVRHSK
jgi:hypothetical protein